jgi:hypothetical protein
LGLHNNGELRLLARLVAKTRRAGCLSHADLKTEAWDVGINGGSSRILFATRFIQTTVGAIVRRKEFEKMSHALPSEPTPFEELSQEEQIHYVETRLDEIVAGLRANKTLEPWETEMLADRLSRYRSQVEGAIPWEEFEKELMKD